MPLTSVELRMGLKSDSLQFEVKHESSQIPCSMDRLKVLWFVTQSRTGGSGIRYENKKLNVRTVCRWTIPWKTLSYVDLHKSFYYDKLGKSSYWSARGHLVVFVRFDEIRLKESRDDRLIALETASATNGVIWQPLMSWKPVIQSWTTSRIARAQMMFMRRKTFILWFFMQ